MPLPPLTTQLPDGILRYVTAGSGPPLVLAPATMSEFDNWTGLIEFLATRFTVYFFELPGHGDSSPLLPYNNEAAAQRIADWINTLPFDRFSFMAFSFGGMLSLPLIQRFASRLDRVILLSPFLDPDALCMHPAVRTGFAAISRLGQKRRPQNMLLASFRSATIRRLWVSLITTLAHVEHPDILDYRIRTLSEAALRTMAGQLYEIFHTQTAASSSPMDLPCYFVMSKRDPLIHFGRTQKIVEKLFPQVQSYPLDLPYHIPREPLTYEFLQKHYGFLLDHLPGINVSHKLSTHEI